MNDFLIYILKSAFSLSLLHLAFRTIMRKEAFFALNRMVLISIVVFSFIIPLLYLPSTVKPVIQQQVIPHVSFQENEAQPTTTFSEINETAVAVPSPITIQKEKPLPYSRGQIIFLIYLAGMLFSFFVFIHGIASVLLMLRKAQAVKMEGYHLFILEKDIPAFSFWKMVFISKADYNKHGDTILAHEQQHIRLGHFYDLMLMEMVKMIHWFNPIIYWLIKDLKAIHEFQADQHTLTKGIDVKKYQLLIIEKGVGTQRFALANSFNHCQIKKRITMINQSKTSKAGIWKVATFLPLLALLLMAFGREGEKEPLSIKNDSLEIKKNDNPNLLFSIEIREHGYYIDKKPYTLNELSTEKKLHEHLLSGSASTIRFITKEGVPISAARFVEIYNFLSHQNPNILMIMMNNADRQAEFPGGVEEIFKWLDKNIRHLKDTSINSIEEEVLVNFLITKEGKVDRCMLLTYGNTEMNAEALRVVSQMPAWKPAMKNGIKVAVDYTIPVIFRRK